jgi:hypothetical protein
MPGANEVIALVSFDFIARCNNYVRYGLPSGYAACSHQLSRYLSHSSEESPPTQVSTQQQQQPAVTSTAVEEQTPSCTAVVEEVALSPVRRPALVGSASPPPASPLSPSPAGKQVYRPNAFTGPCALLIALHLLSQAPLLPPHSH